MRFPISAMQRHQEALQIVPVTLEDGTRLLQLQGELDLFTGEPLRNYLSDLEKGPLQLDLSRLCFIDSTGLAILLVGREIAKRHGTALSVCGAAGQVRELLDRTGVMGLFADPSIQGAEADEP
jgi:anti-anti-sigma factor